MTQNINSLRGFFDRDVNLFSESIFKPRRSTCADILSGPFRLATQATILKTGHADPAPDDQDTTIEFVKIAIVKTRDRITQQTIDKVNDFSDANPDMFIIAANRNTAKSNKNLDEIVDGILKVRDDARTIDGGFKPLIIAEPEKPALTQRQKNILGRIAAGDTNKKIALETGLCENTIKVHVRNILNRLGASNRKEAACKAALLLRD